MRKILTNWRVIMLVVFLVFSLIAIRPQLFDTGGVMIRSVTQDSAAFNGGIANPPDKVSPLDHEMIVAINGKKIDSIEDYTQAISGLQENATVRVETNKAAYTLLAHSTEDDVADLGMRVMEAPRSNLRKGLDLAGGTRVLLQPSEEVSDDEVELTVASLKERLNVYGLSDVVVRPAKDLSGDSFILVEIAGFTEEELKDVLARQGKFEAKIGNQTVFFGGKKDVTYVCRSADCSGIDPQRGCSSITDGYACNFFFSITLSPEAAQRHADVTETIDTVSDEYGQYLSDDLVLFLDDAEVDRLRVAADLKGRVTTNIQISGSGTGRTQQEATTNTLDNMKRLQTILITGSLPTKLDVVKMDTISPTLGEEFFQNILLVGLLVVLAVTTVVIARYRKLKVVIPMLGILFSEILLILGFAALVGWNLDMAAFAGILIVAGTGVDHLIVITDETLKGEAMFDWKRRIKNAMFIVMGAYLTTLSGMLPLLWAGAGLLKGFALTTIAGISFGVLIARPAYAAIIQELLQDEE